MEKVCPKTNKKLTQQTRLGNKTGKREKTAVKTSRK
jgi:hypothetical protein